MLSKKLNDALNKHMNLEFHSAYSYLAAVAHFETEELPGFANFYSIQAKEELTHAMKFFNFIQDAGGQAKLADVAAPRQSYKSPLDVFEASLKQEQNVSSEINKLLDLAIAEKHAGTRVFLQWFVTEQLEEEALFNRCIRRIKIAGKDGQGLLLIDQELGKRTGDGEAAAE
ncbi:MAG: ferritin [Planctomycetes bacterium]|nr:ferritin [Planctomycetota bacterium]